jgi:signal transduction histidine kinase/DNA-binding response OmpR family regulator
MSEKTNSKFSMLKEKGNMTINVRIFTVIMATAIVINISGLIVGAAFFTRSISKAIEEDMLVAVDIADQYVTKEIQLLKIMSGDAARDVDLLYGPGEGGHTLKEICDRYPVFTGLAVFNGASLVDFCGEVSFPPDLYREGFMRAAQEGGQAVSTTMYSPDGPLVMYVSAPIRNDFVLAAVLPGLHFSSIVSEFSFWQTGHLFICDGNGNVISNYRTEWVQRRANFIDMAKDDVSFEGIAALVSRGISGERATGFFNMDGERRISALRPLSSPNEGWFVGIIVSLSESAMKEIPGGILLIGIITLLLSVVVAILASFFLKHPYEEVDRLRKEAEAMSISKSAFLANMSHEIRMPMNSIVGFSELALDGEPSPRTRDYLSKIQTNAEWLLQIINDILDISKVESGKMDLENIPFDMHELFSNCRTLIMPKAVEKGITLYFYVEPSIGKRPLGDPTRLRQVLVNLLSNAVKFTNNGMVKLHAVLKEKEENSITMYFEIKDSGIGMYPEQINKIFDPFARAESGIAHKYGGTGLGLAITKNIVELMGGKLFVESTPGIGSKFSFELTFDTVNVSDEELLDSKIVINELEKPSFEGEVLLCEDNAMNQQVICEHLARVGIKTIVAENGKIGVDLVRRRLEKGEKMFDLIFMDMHMPVMDGLDAASKILELDTKVPIVAMTANIMANDREIYRRSGMNDCVGKPFTSQELWRCLMKYFTPVAMEDVKKSVQIEADMEFQRSLQLLFVKSNRNKFEEITEALEKGDIEMAHRLAHTLKGNAGQIGKTILQQAALDVEHQLKDGHNMVTAEQLKTLEAELAMVLTELAPLLEEAAGRMQEDEIAEIDPEKTRELFGKLELLLKSGNPKCLDFSNELRKIQGSAKLVQHMEDFEFEMAFSSLEELKEKYKILF